MSYFGIVPRHRPTLIQALRLSLERIEEREQLKPDDPVLLQLKQSILTSITELEMEKSHEDSEESAA